MATDILMPQLGESIAEGTVVKWLIPVGGMVERDQSLLEVETEKVALEIPSPAAGRLSEILVKEGETVPVGTVLGRIDGAPPTEVINRVGGVVVRSRESVAEEERATRGAGGAEAETTLHYSPAVRHLAKQYGVDLSQVKGTGAGGRITKKDVEDFIAHRHTEAAQSVSTTERSATTEEHETGDEIVPLTLMRKTIAERMVNSRRTAAHVTTVFEADFSGIVKFREGRPLTYLPFVIQAVARAIRDVPIMNSSWSDEGIVIKKDIHIGIATALEDGLLVPVVRHADRKGLMQLAEEIADLAERARSKRLNPDEVLGGTFSITNHGGFGSLFSTPIIHQPQIAILGVGAVQKRPVVIHDAIAIRSMAYLSLSFDHRVIDGATADRFMARVKDAIEHSDWERNL
ncbi:dihydrolipoamide acetyltransferase family protein [Candidatus Nitrospira inopinata]|jgi:2-oxoglutarate dehydrogenase E2 component (dihydrolipoamide succinyltransferase)/2-oxoisovalerate dehydrogenase E2 component (dihydrolipoyl transacylase)|uniref:Dihydrolipoamide acetyltransferase component of pyruvate dehydrogenase complex n=1 Tax=Candidatus Nitrospira inopinata TaxID=1715989 RepID=A0A0S4KWC8_9BACT|nr:dihydrolipoamide acetyltransferase family protein [Candidatus Nitrospira inopinata]CUQ65922.1 branched-chain alpha-keto acid dehydrogenase, dihydrolipoamide acyltransferase (E2) component [Candidatus Nitrospira inopinata]